MLFRIESIAADQRVWGLRDLQLIRANLVDAWRSQWERHVWDNQNRYRLGCGCVWHD